MFLYSIAPTFFFLYLLDDLILIHGAPPLIRSELRTFNIQDQRKNNVYYEGRFEHHCFNIDNGNHRNYVRGTYGNYGYFEGAVDAIDSFLFRINWYETSINNMYGISGSAVLNYSATWNAVSGVFWIGGTGDFNLNSFRTWSSNNGTYIIDDTTTTGSESLLFNCLYPGIQHEQPRNSVSLLQDTSLTSSSTDGENTFCRAPVHGFSLWFGTYRYVYSMDKDGVTGTETGNYGLNSLGFFVSSGVGFVGEWKAITGPFSGDRGSNLYLILSASTKLVVVGFYCFIDTTSRTQCEREYYEVLTDKSSKDYVNGINSCPSLYRQDDSFQPLYQYVSSGYQHRLQCDHNDPLTAWTLAIIFMIFSGLLIFTFVYIILVTKLPKSATISPYT